jgi:hypothetical protein
MGNLGYVLLDTIPGTAYQSCVTLTKASQKSKNKYLGKPSAFILITAI